VGLECKILETEGYQGNIPRENQSRTSTSEEVSVSPHGFATLDFRGLDQDLGSARSNTKGLLQPPPFLLLFTPAQRITEYP